MTADFPSLTIRSDALIAQGDYARAQADYLHPDPDVIERLGRELQRTETGVVAHFYMDPELQGVLTAVGGDRIHISDSLKMSDAAITMADAGARRIVVLGVDFMSENVRAMLDAAGHTGVPVYRVSADAIGCSLAQAAESRAYSAWLHEAAKVPRALHVVYVNTSLLTKAHAEAVVPTITCTSSNVIGTVLQAAAQIPDVSIFYGPDTYMGENLRRYFAELATLGDEVIARVHPAHDEASIRSLLARFHGFQQGVCIVHHMFGSAVAARIARDYRDAFITAHLEVPGEMFELALAAANEHRGVVGSTADILGFVSGKIDAALAEGSRARLRFVLGTEAGMITSIVRAVQARLAMHAAADVSAEIVFPVAGEAIAVSSESELAIVPGVAAGEGCSPAGGCATCPYMKVNSLDALFDVLTAIANEAPMLRRYQPRAYAQKIAGRSAAELGGRTILAMRHLGRTRELSPELVARVLGSTEAVSPAV